MKIKYSLTVLLAILVFTGCIKNDPVILREQLVEFDATSFNNNSLGFASTINFPILGRNPGFGRVSNTTDSTIRRFAQTLRLRVNLIGPQSSKDETVGFEIFGTPIITFNQPATASSQTPSAPGATLGIFDAVAGVDYALPTSKALTIPANSSFGFLDLQILASPAAPGTGRFIGIRLNNTGSLKVSVNFSELGLVIDKR
ncbi:MAG: hypothetical protein WKF91_10535 [Segetibacter sp.]